MLQNLHTHTTLCDGKNAPEEMIEKAINLGFDSLGFSAHAKTEFHTDWELHCSVGEYVKKINALKSEYADRIEIFLGAELDYYSKEVMPTEILDYTIGSVHMTVKDGVVLDFDHSYEATKKNIDLFFGGNSLEYARSYYEKVVEMSKQVDYDIVGHFDLLTKFSEKDPDLIGIDSKAYRDLALDALHAVKKNKEFFEVNTGAISRGYRTTPYPSPFILDEMKRLDCKLILTSDCHNMDFLDAHFKESKEYIAQYGFDTLYYLTNHGFEAAR